MGNFRDKYLFFLEVIKNNYLIIAIAIFPLLLLLINRNWLFLGNPYGGFNPWEGNVDNWVNVGYFLNYEKYYQNFGQLYYGDRVSWIFPGYFLNHIFSPLLANYILHLIFFSVALVSLFLIIKYTFNEKTAFFTSLLMGSYAFFIHEIGSNYVPGAAITYTLLTILFLTLSVKTSHKEVFLFASGVCCISMVYAHMFTIFFLPFFALYYVVTAYFERPRKLTFGFLFFVAGAGTITTVYGIINDLLIGNWFFYSKQLQMFFYFAQTSYPIIQSYPSHLLTDSLILPGILFGGCCLSLFITFINNHHEIKNKFFYIFQLQYILIFILFFFYSMQTNQLPPPFYLDLLIPFVFLAMAPYISIIFGGLEGDRFGGFLILLIFVFSLPLIIYNFSPFNLPIIKYIAIGIFMILIFQNSVTVNFGWTLKNPKIKKILFSIILILLCLTYVIFNSCLYTSNSYTNIDFHGIDSQENGYIAVIDSVKIINEGISTDHVRFWYNINETNENGSYGGLYGSINSAYLWMYTYISQDFPNIDKSKFEALSYWPEPPPNVAILSTDANAFKEAQNSLNAIGYNATVISEKRVEHGKIEFNITFINITKIKSG